MREEANVTERTELDLKRCPYYKLDSAALESQHHKRRICSLLYKSGFEGWKSMGIKHSQFLSPKSFNVAPNLPKFTVNEIPQATQSADGTLLGMMIHGLIKFEFEFKSGVMEMDLPLRSLKGVVEFVILFERRCKSSRRKAPRDGDSTIWRCT
ncbi:hypothetical protein ACH5RR_026883 [Cinchona calisaya]|uniref:Uncharacterized protein n=1 Tax=Cinchona calisaya TaxID=153742 RepID=A0ABD2Z5R2_9GENT